MFDLYKDLIIDHGLNPRNKYVLDKFTNSAKGFNHFCGDSFCLYLNVVNSYIKEISFDGSGCSISIASASLMTLSLKNKSIVESLEIFNYFKGIIRGDIECKDNLPNINVLSSVKKFPSRVKCATLIWHTLHDALIHKM